MQKQSLTALTRHFDAPVKYAFAYGSGVFSQGSAQRNKRTQIDLILGVQDPREWHEKNIAQHPDHYSFLKYLGPSAVALTQEKLGAGVYFNPYCNLDGHSVKYGVVSLATLHDDLANWRTLYLAGRMHKPVQVLIQNDEVRAAQEHNLLSAMAVALLLLPRNFSEKDLYMKLAGVSYLGDVRMAFAENPHKIRNIVSNQFLEFRKLYRPLFDTMKLAYPEPPALDGGVGPDAEGIPIEKPEDDTALLQLLPKKFADRLGGPEAVTRLRVANAVRSTVKWPSVTQSMKGILTAGVGRSAVYSLEKLKKRFGAAK